MHSNRSDYHRPQSSGGGHSSRGYGQGAYGQGGYGGGGGYGRGGGKRNSRGDDNYYRQQNDEKVTNYGRGGSLPTGRNGSSNYKPKHQGLSKVHRSPHDLISLPRKSNGTTKSSCSSRGGKSLFSSILSSMHDRSFFVRSQW